MTDIVERLRVWCHRPDHLAIKDLLDEAARSITDWQLEADVHRKRAAAAVAENARLRLTDEEREAVENAITLRLCDAKWEEDRNGTADNARARKAKREADTLLKMLERLK